MTDTLILIIEDEPQIRKFLHVTLAGHGYRIIESDTGTDGLSQAFTRNPDLIVLDLGLPDLDGVTVIGRLREWSAAPVIVISARDREDDKIKALDAGADDYVTKPFGAGELLARMRVALRHRVMRLSGKNETIYEFGRLKIDLDRRQVFRHSAEVHLTPLEFKLLETLLHNADRVVTHRQLLEEVWGRPYISEIQYLRVYMKQLRHKLEDDPARPRYFINEPGAGYRFVTGE